jgi:dihydropteroate synthase
MLIRTDTNPKRARTNFIAKRGEHGQGEPCSEFRLQAARRTLIPPERGPLNSSVFTFVLFLLTFSFMPLREWKIGRRVLPYGERTLVMGVLNITPDSFSDGGEFFSLDRAVAHAEQMIAEGADVIDIGGESTRPGSEFVSEQQEMDRVIPVIERLITKASVPISIDTTKSSVARAALEAGAEIVNDISGLRFDPAIADEAVRARAGLVLMHSRGTPKVMQQLPPVENIMVEVVDSLRESISIATERGVPAEGIAIDPGIGFGKTVDQNLELIVKLDQLAREFADFPIVIGTSRKSFIGKLLGGAPVEERLHGSIATVVVSVLKGAHVVRVHDVKATVQAVHVADAIHRADAAGTRVPAIYNLRH